MGLLSWLESTAYSDWILTSYTGWPLMLSAHAVGLAIIVGIVFSLNLRMLGLYSAIPFSTMCRFVSVAWIGLFINLFTGLSLFMTQATTYITSLPFLVKITFIILGSVNLYYTRKIIVREAEGWESLSRPAPLAVGLAVSSFVFWTVAIVTGRLIAYL